MKRIRLTLKDAIKAGDLEAFVAQAAPKRYLPHAMDWAYHGDLPRA